MSTNRAIIPLYLNTDMLNNLFTIVIQEFVEIKSMSTKDTVTVHLKTPMSELSYDLFGKFMQGELDIQIQNEFTKQRTEERISTTIVILKKLKDILSSQGLLKNMSGSSTEKGIEVNDYVEFPCKIKRNPYIENLINTINMLEIQGAVNNKSDEVTADMTAAYNSNIMNMVKRKELLDYLKSSLTTHKQERCIRYIADNTDNLFSAVIPIKMASLLDHEDYLLSGNVTILGKVIKNISTNDTSAVDSNNDEVDYEYLISNDAFFDNIDYESLHSLHCPFLRKAPQARKVRGDSYRKPNCEILPIAIYI